MSVGGELGRRGGSRSWELDGADSARTARETWVLLDCAVSGGTGKGPFRGDPRKRKNEKMGLVGYGGGCGSGNVMLSVSHSRADSGSM